MARNMPDAIAAEVSSQLPADRWAGYFNTGTIGPLPRLVHAEMAKIVQAELGRDRVSFEAYRQFRDQVPALRAALGNIVGAGPEELALTRGTTQALNTVIWGLDWKPGDAAVTTNIEHGAALIPLYQLHRRHGVEIRFANARSGDPQKILEAFATLIRPGIRLVVLSHVAYDTGAVLPVREIAALAHGAGALVLVDGAQAVGAIAVNFHELGADCYAFSGQKWLCGPEGTGGLVISAAAMEHILPTYLSDGHEYQLEDPCSLRLPGDASRYESGGLVRSAVAGMAASVSWLSGDLGMPAIYRRIRELREHCVERLRELDGAIILASQESLAGIVAFTPARRDPESCVRHLEGHGIDIRALPDNAALRICCGFFNSAGEIDRAVGLIQELA